MEVLLDTNFIISCILRKIDFLAQLEEKGFRIVVPREVLQELKDVKFQRKTSHDERNAIDVALELLYSKKVEKTTIGDGKVDDLLIRKGLEGAY